MADPFIGEIRMFAGNFAPKDWAFCDGRLMPIRQYTALFSLLGTNFGGDGKVTFGLPNLRDRVPMHWGQGPGLTNRALGASGGENAVTLKLTEMAAHTHSPGASNAPGDQLSPANGFWSSSETRDKQFGNTAPDVKMAAPMDPVGGGLPHENRAPFLAVSYIIALNGVFPPRP